MNKLLVAKEKPKQIAFQNYNFRNKHVPPSTREFELPAKRKRKQSGYREGLLFCGLIFCLIIISVSLISQYSRVLAVNFKINQVGREISQLKEEQEHLTIEVKRLASLDRIETIARDDLGLQYSKDKQWLVSARGE